MARSREKNRPKHQIMRLLTGVLMGVLVLCLALTVYGYFYAPTWTCGAAFLPFFRKTMLKNRDIVDALTIIKGDRASRGKSVYVIKESAGNYIPTDPDAIYLRINAVGKVNGCSSAGKGGVRGTLVRTYDDIKDFDGTFQV